MADEVFEYLHMSIVQYYSNKNIPKNEIIESIELLGYRVGNGIIERIAPEQRLTDDVSIMKYICKEFWITLFSKQIDNLRTNNSGIFVLQDNNFRFLTQISHGKQYIDVLDLYLSFSAGMLRGALTNLGHNCSVSVECQQIPICRFQINLHNQIQQPQMSITQNSNQQLSNKTS